MGYKYNYDDLRNMMLTSGYNTSDWSTNIQLIAQSFNDFVENDAFTGKWADNVKNYLSQVHVTSMTAVAQLISDFNSKMLVFVDGAYQYEMHESAKIPEERLVAGETLLESMYTYYQEVHSEIKQLVDDVSGIVDVTMPSNESILSRITEIKTDLTAYKDDLYEYDQQWTRDLAELEEFITATKTIVTEICNNKGRNITAYQDGSFYELEAVQEMLAGYETSYDYVVNNQDRINLANQHQATVADIVNDRLAEERKEQGVILVIGGLMALVMCAYVICASGGTMAPVAMTIVKGTLSSSAFAYGTSNIYQGIQEIEYGEAGDVTTVAVNPIRDTVFAGNQAAYDLWGELTMTACTFYVPLSKGFPASGSGATLSIKSPVISADKYDLKCAWKEFAHETAEEIVENKVTNGIDVALSTTDTKASTRMMAQIAGCTVTGKMGDVSPSAKTAADWCTPGINRVDFGVNNGKINTVIDCNPPAGGKTALSGKTTNVDISTSSKVAPNVDVKMDVSTKAGDVEMNVPQKTKVEIDAKIETPTKASEVEINTPQKTELEANANVAKATGTDDYNPKQNNETINIPTASKTKVEISTKSDNSKIDTPKDIEVKQDVKLESITKAKEAEIKSLETSKAEADVKIDPFTKHVDKIIKAPEKPTVDVDTKINKMDDFVDKTNKDSGSSKRLIPGTEGVTTGGSSKVLGENLFKEMGLDPNTSRKGYQAQHIIPKEFMEHPVLKKIGMDFDDASNGLFLRNRKSGGTSATSRHQGGHPQYSNVILERLEAMDINKSVSDLEREVFNLQQSAKRMMQDGHPIYAKDYAPTSANSKISVKSEKIYGVDVSTRTEDFIRRTLKRYET